MLFKLFKQINNNENSSQNSRIDKLCDKIDGLITSYAENTQKLNAVLLNNDKDQKNVSSTLDKILGVAIENQRRIARIDDRTYQCLGNPRKEEKE